MLLSHIDSRTVSEIPIFLFKWKIQKLLLMYIGGSSIILTKKISFIVFELAKLRSEVWYLIYLTAQSIKNRLIILTWLKLHTLTLV